MRLQNFCLLISDTLVDEFQLLVIMFLFFQDSVDFCVICVVKNDDRDPIVEKVKEVSVDFACEANWLGGKRKSRRFVFFLILSFFLQSCFLIQSFLFQVRGCQ
jgi:hypothetical protein